MFYPTPSLPRWLLSASIAVLPVLADLTAQVTIGSPDGSISGSGTLKWIPDGGTQIAINIDKGLKAVSYSYHIHTEPVGKSFNCTASKGHLDPMGGGDCSSCKDAATCKPYLCQEGDLSGKHQPVNGTAEGKAVINLTDGYVRWWCQDFSVLGRSIVLHDPDGNRVACGDILSTQDGTLDASGNPTGAASTYQTYPERNYPAVGDGNVGWIPAVASDEDKAYKQIELVIAANGTRSVHAVDPPFVYSDGATLPTCNTGGQPSSSASSSAPGGSPTDTTNLLSASQSGIQLQPISSNGDGSLSTPSGGQLPSDAQGGDLGSATDSGATPSDSGLASTAGGSSSSGVEPLDPRLTLTAFGLSILFFQ